MSKTELTMYPCPKCGGSTPLAGDFCIRCGEPNAIVQAFDAALESALAKSRLPENTRAVDLTAETMRAFRNEKLGPLTEAGRLLGVKVMDLQVGNVGGHAGQFVTATVEMPSDPKRQAEVRDTAIGLMLYVFGGDPDMVSVRVEFIDRRGRRIAHSVTDSTDCTELMVQNEGVMAQYLKTHTLGAID
jgi:hypothetical protein